MEEIPYSAQLLLRQGLEAENAKLRAERDSLQLQKYEAAAEYLRAEAKKIPLGEGNVQRGFSSTYNALIFCAKTLERACAQKPKRDGLQLGEARNLPYPRPISDDDAKKRNGELLVALRELVAKVHEVNKGTEYLFAFAQNHSMGPYSGPQYGEELIRAGRLAKGCTVKQEAKIGDRPQDICALCYHQNDDVAHQRCLAERAALKPKQDTGEPCPCCTYMMATGGPCTKCGYVVSSYVVKRVGQPQILDAAERCRSEEGNDQCAKPHGHSGRHAFGINEWN